MAKRTRDRLKKKAAQIFNNLEKAELGITELYELFKDADKPETEVLKIVVETFLLGEEVFNQFCQKSWAVDKETLKKYRT